MPPQIEAWLRALTAWDVLAYLLWIGVLVAGLRWIAPVLRRVRTLIDKLHDIADDWHGTPEVKDGAGVTLEEAKPGVIARLNAIEYEVRPNHGGSAHDAIMAKLDEVAASLEAFKEESTADRADLRRRITIIPDPMTPPTPD